LKGAAESRCVSKSSPNSSLTPRREATESPAPFACAKPPDFLRDSAPAVSFAALTPPGFFPKTEPPVFVAVSAKDLTFAALTPPGFFPKTEPPVRLALREPPRVFDSVVLPFRFIRATQSIA
jgi:hypothetical protein